MPRRRPSAGEERVITCPSMRIVPASGVSAPDRILMSVDLPAPFWPTSACTSPASSSKSTPLRAWTTSNDLSIASIRSTVLMGHTWAGVGSSALLPTHGALERVLIDVALGEHHGRAKDQHLLGCEVLDRAEAGHHVLGLERHALGQLYAGPHRQIAQLDGVPQHEALDRAVLDVRAHQRGHGDARGKHPADLVQVGYGLGRARR